MKCAMFRRGHVFHFYKILCLIVGPMIFISVALGQDNFGNEDVFQMDIISVEVRDLDHRLIRDWDRLLGVRLDDTWILRMQDEGIYVPNPLVAERNEVEYLPEDEEYSNLFNSNGSGRVRIPIVKPGQNGPANVEYQYTFRDSKGRLHYESAKQFFVHRDESNSLPPTIFAPWHTHRTTNEWLIVLLLYILAIAFVTFGIYRPFYVWRLHRSDAAFKSRDWAVSIWLFFSFALWGLIVWFWAPRHISIWTILGILGLLWLINLLINAIRPHEEGF